MQIWRSPSYTERLCTIIVWLQWVAKSTIKFITYRTGFHVPTMLLGGPQIIRAWLTIISIYKPIQVEVLLANSCDCYSAMSLKALDLVCCASVEYPLPVYLVATQLREGIPSFLVNKSCLYSMVLMKQVVRSSDTELCSPHHRCSSINEGR